MMLTKETMIHIAVVTAVTGSVFALILNSGATNLDELEIQVFARADLVNDIVFLSYTIHNMGDYTIQNVTVTVDSISHVKLLHNPDSTPLIHILESKEYLDVIPVTGMTPGDEIIVQFDAYDTLGNYDVDIMTVLLE